jgi:AcrR family transcriptional regulator
MSAAKRTTTPKREHLLATAFDLFYREGYHAVGIDKILKEAGLAKMTLYHHFKSKEELIVAALDRRAGEITSMRQAALGKAPGDGRRQLNALFDLYRDWFQSDGFKGCGFIRAIAEYPEANTPVNTAARAVKESLLAILTEILGSLTVKDTTAAARQIFLLIEGAIVSAHTFNRPEAIEDARSAAMALVAARR